MKATSRKLNSVWTLEFNEIPSDDNNEIEIIRFSRMDPEGYEKENELPSCTIMEDENRTALKVLLKNTPTPFGWVTLENCDRILYVKNPRHIFNYGA